MKQNPLFRGLFCTECQTVVEPHLSVRLADCCGCFRLVRHGDNRPSAWIRYKAVKDEGG